MVTNTFLQLPDEKKEKIESVLLTIFTEKPLGQVKVAEIIQSAGISRGAFYKYFRDLEDAYSYVIRLKATKIHGEILQAIAGSKKDFFGGIERYLIQCSQLDRHGEEWKSLLLLVQKSDQFAKRKSVKADHPMINEWLSVLEDNQFVVHSTEEAISFLYFAMLWVINLLTSLIVNQWSEEEIRKEFAFQKKWLANGLVKK